MRGTNTRHTAPSSPAGLNRYRPSAASDMAGVRPVSGASVASPTCCSRVVALLRGAGGARGSRRRIARPVAAAVVSVRRRTPREGQRRVGAASAGAELQAALGRVEVEHRALQRQAGLRLDLAGLWHAERRRRGKAARAGRRHAAIARAAARRASGSEMLRSGSDTAVLRSVGRMPGGPVGTVAPALTAVVQDATARRRCRLRDVCCRALRRRASSGTEVDIQAGDGLRAVLSDRFGRRCAAAAGHAAAPGPAGRAANGHSAAARSAPPAGSSSAMLDREAEHAAWAQHAHARRRTPRPVRRRR